MVSGLFADKPTYRKFLIVVFVILLSTMVFTMLAGLLVDLLYGIDLMENPTVFSNLEDPVVLSAMKLMQFLSTGIGMFLVPSLVAAWLFSDEPATYLQMKTKTGAGIFLMTIFIMFAAVPVINLLLVWNQDMQLPSFLSGLEKWMKESEDNATKLTEALLVMPTTGSLIYNLFIVALLPALGEELLFRGILQKLFKELTNNIHLSIFITAIIFSAIHIQFYGFFPRMMLGVLFGYLLFWTGNIWVPILAHFVNNCAAVIFAYVSSKQKLPFDQDTIGTTEGDWIWVMISVFVLIGALGMIWKSRQGQEQVSDNMTQ